MAIKDYNTDPDLNTTISGINIAEGCPPSGINNAIRQLMADVKAESEATQATQAAKDAEQAAKDAEQAAKDAEQDTAIARVGDAVTALGEQAVHKTGNETIGGKKTFTNGTATPTIALKNPDVVKGSHASNTEYYVYEVVDANGERIGDIQFAVRNNGQYDVKLDISNGTESASLEVGVSPENVPYAYAPTTPEGSERAQIVTANWLYNRGFAEVIPTKANADANTFLTTGSYWLSSTATNIPTGSNGLLCVYRISGVVRQVFYRQGTIDDNDYMFYTRQLGSFVDGVPTKIGKWVRIQAGPVVVVEGATPRVYINDVDITKGTAPSAEHGQGMVFRDSANTSIGEVLYHVYKNGDAKIELSAYNFMGSGKANMGVTYSATKGPFAYVPTPPADSNTNDIATTEWVRGKGVLVESWHDGTEWYRKYGDGWIEQGGMTSTPRDRVNTDVVLPTPFTTEQYTVQVTDNGGTDVGDGAYIGSVYVPSMSTSKFQIHSGWGGTHRWLWYACGY